MKRKNRDICACLIIVSVLLVITVIISLIVVESPVESKASNDAWLTFIGSISGGFIAAFASFSILYLNRKDMMEFKTLDRSDTSEDERQQEVDKVREQVKDLFLIASLENTGKEMISPSITSIKNIPCVLNNSESDFFQVLCLFEQEFESSEKVDYKDWQEKLSIALNDLELKYVKSNE